MACKTVTVNRKCQRLLSFCHTSAKIHTNPTSAESRVRATSLLIDLNWTEQYPTASTKPVQIITMIRATPTKPEAEPVPVRLFGTEATQPETDPRQTTEIPPNFPDGGCHPSLLTGAGEVSLRPKEQDWTSTHTRQMLESPAAAEETFHDDAPLFWANAAKGHGNPSAGRPSSLSMKQHVLSSVYASPSARQELSSINGPFVQNSGSLDQPNLRRCQSWLGTRPSYHWSALGRQPRPRRRSMCGQSNCVAGETGAVAPTFNSATVRRWCEEFRETSVANWQQTVTGFGQTWKQRCFAQRRARVWQDSLIREAIKSFWQPLSDFNYVLSVYSFLEGVKNNNLLPHLRRTYLTWRSPEQTRLHEDFGLTDRGDGSLEKNTSGEDEPLNGNSRATASKYPLTIHQNLGVARICGDVDGKLKNLQHGLNEFQNRREACTRACKEAGHSSAIMAEYQSDLTDAATECSSLAETLTKQLTDSRIHLCEALGLGPKQVPGGHTASIPTMTVMKYEEAADTPRACQGRVAHPRSFFLKTASLQASRIALKLNLYITVLPRKIAQGILERTMARSTQMANTAREAGDHKAEATMHRLHNKMRKVHERTGQEFPDVKPKMTLLDSETWAAVLNPREDMEVEVHGHISIPVETLIDLMLAPQVPFDSQGGQPSETGSQTAAASTMTAPEDTFTERPSGSCHPLSTSSLTTTVPKAETDQV